MLVRFWQDVVALRPRVVHIMAGTNDIAGNTGPGTLTVGADNVFDVYPDENDDRGDVAANVAGNANFGIFPYNGISPFGFNGRFLYARASIDF